MRRSFLVFPLLWLACSTAFAQQLPDVLGQSDGLGGFGVGEVKVAAFLQPAKPKVGDTVTLSVTLTIPPGHHTYPQTAKTAIPTKIRVKTAPGLEPLGKGFSPTKKPKQKLDPESKETYAIFEGVVTWTRKFKVQELKGSDPVVDGTIRYQICTDTSCKPPVTVAFKTSAGAIAGEKTSEPKTTTKPSADKNTHPFAYLETPKRAGKPDPLNLKFELKPKTAKPGDEVTLSITAKFDKGWHAYALTQPRGGIGLPIIIRVKTLKGLEPVGKGWRPDRLPKIKVETSDGERIVTQEHEGTVTWSRTFKVAKTAEAGAIGASGSFRYQICQKACLFPKTIKFSLGDLNGAKTAPKSANDIQRDLKPAKPSRPAPRFSYQEIPQRGKLPEPLKLKYELKPANAKPGDEVTLSITAEFDSGWHAYALTQSEEGVGLPVVIRVKDLKGLEPVGKGWRPDQAPTIKVTTEDGRRVVNQEHKGTVTWRRKFQVAKTAEAGRIGVTGSFGYQICDEGSCKPMQTVTYSLGDLEGAKPAPGSANEIDKTPFPKSADEQDAAGSLALYLLLAFAGGLILNVMPCVLPVLAIKVMTFVQQAGEDRRRVLMLNVMYSIGVVSVFLLLATLAVGIATGGQQLGWGGLFRLSEFNIVMGAVVFAMGLSLLGVYEIPIPGFVGSTAGGQSEGPGAAFLTGIMATVLATPCSGPFLGVTLAWSVKQPPEVTYLVWATMGVGMAFPYLMLGVFPKAIRFLPQPGEWMVRFKEISGFVLMGTTLWVIRTLDKSELVYTLIVLVAIGLSLWIVGNFSLPNVAKSRRWMIRATALAIVLFALSAGTRALENVADSRFYSWLHAPWLLATTSVLLGLAVAWWPLQASFREGAAVFRVWMLRVVAASLCVISGVGAYAATTMGVELPWQPYSEKRLNEELKQGNIVLIDFTADW